MARVGCSAAAASCSAAKMVASLQSRDRLLQRWRQHDTGASCAVKAQKSDEVLVSLANRSMWRGILGRGLWVGYRLTGVGGHLAPVHRPDRASVC